MPPVKCPNPDKVARTIFVLTLAYVFAVAGSIWMFVIRA